MKRLTSFTILVLITVLVFAQEVPQKISYQGKLFENGMPVNGNKDISFTIGSWTEEHENVEITEGLYSVVLGSDPPIPSSLFDENSSLQLEIEVDGTVLEPKTDILTSPYAFKAEKSVDTEKIGGNVVSTINPGSDQVLKWNGNSWAPGIDNIGPTYSAGTGINISGSTISAQTNTALWNANKLQGFPLASSSPSNDQVLGWNGTQWEPANDGLSLPFEEIYNISNYAAIEIINTGTPTHIVVLENDNQNSNTKVMDLTSNGSGVVLDISNDGTGGALNINNEGTYAIDIDNNGIGDAININNSASSSGNALYVTQGNDSKHCARFQINNSNNPKDAIYARTQGTGNAGYFYGDVEVNGYFSSSNKYFKIDHPLEPEKKYLYHSCVESSDMMNVYNGNIVLDSKGEAIVVLPEWFDALNKDFRYQLTCIGGFAPVYIAEKISVNNFRIAGGISGMEVSWQVTGIRQDPYANQNRMQVEVEKSEEEKGHYLHYKEYNQPFENSIEAIKDPDIREK